MVIKHSTKKFSSDLRKVVLSVLKLIAWERFDNFDIWISRPELGDMQVLVTPIVDDSSTSKIFENKIFLHSTFDRSALGVENLIKYYKYKFNYGKKGD